MNNKRGHFKLNNNGFTLLESMICFALLGILLVAASQIIASSTEVFYQTKSVSYGLQASQIVLTEIRGELEKAQTLQVIPGDTSLAYIKISNSNSQIEFVSIEGKRILYSVDRDSETFRIKKQFQQIYNQDYIVDTNNQLSTPDYSINDIGMGYTISEIRFEKQVRTLEDAEGVFPDYPIIKITVKVFSEKYGEYIASEYVPLYNFNSTDEIRILES